MPEIAPAVTEPANPAPAVPSTPDPAAPAAVEATKTFTQEDVDKIVKDRADRMFRQRVGDVDLDDLKTKAAEFDKAQDAAKTAEQRAAEQAQRAQNEARIAAERADRAELGVEHGIGRDHLDLLGGGTREEMAARAQRLAPLLNAVREVEQLRAEVAALREGRPAPATARPVASLQPGAAPVVVTTDDDSYPSHWIPQRG